MRVENPCRASSEIKTSVYPPSHSITLTITPPPTPDACTCRILTFVSKTLFGICICSALRCAFRRGGDNILLASCEGSHVSKPCISDAEPQNAHLNSNRMGRHAAHNWAITILQSSAGRFDIHFSSSICYLRLLCLLLSILSKVTISVLSTGISHFLHDLVLVWINDPYFLNPQASLELSSVSKVSNS